MSMQQPTAFHPTSLFSLHQIQRRRDGSSAHPSTTFVKQAIYRSSEEASGITFRTCQSLGPLSSDCPRIAASFASISAVGSVFVTTAELWVPAGAIPFALDKRAAMSACMIPRLARTAAPWTRMARACAVQCHYNAIFRFVCKWTLFARCADAAMETAQS